MIGLVGLVLSNFLLALRSRVSFRVYREFLATRDLRSDLRLNADERSLVLHPSVPSTLGLHPWCIEVEDSVSVFFPFLHNGQTCSVRVREEPCFKFIKRLLQHRNCRGVLTHVQSTRHGLARLFDDPSITRKLYHVPAAYVPVDEVPPAQRSLKQRDEPLVLFFNNSWHQAETNFYLRGGHYTLEVLRKGIELGLNLSLVIRSRIPQAIREEYADLLTSPQVRVYEDFLAQDAYTSLLASADVCMLPAARIHVVSILESMYYGQVLITSDGWGIQEYVKNEQTGLIVPGVYGKVSWLDENDGFLREDYRVMFDRQEVFVERLLRQVARLREDPELLANLSKAAAQAVRKEFSLERYNRGFTHFLEQAMI